MTENNRKFYLENGYVILKSALSETEIKTIHSDIHTIIKQQLQTLGLKVESETNASTIFSDMRKLHSADLNKYLASLKLCAKTISIFQGLMNPNVLNFTKSLGITLPVFQTQPVFHVMAEKLRIQDGYFGVGAHQDWPALQSGLDTVTTWVPLVPVKANSYTLEIIPKSHLLGFCESNETQNIHEIPAEVYKHLDFIKIQMDPGDVLVFSVFLIHKSETPSNSDAFRMAYSMRYENASDLTFISRNYPFSQKRVVDRALAAEDIPKIKDVQKRFQ